MKTFLLLTMVQLFSCFSRASVLPLDTILNKTCALAGNSIISVNQDVVFHDSGKEYIVREEWLIEGDKNLRLNAIGTGELKDLVRIHSVYNGDKMTQISGKNRVTTKISRDFFERFLAIKSRDSYLGYLSEMGIASKVRLSRAGGTICFAVGNASTETVLSPQLWIDHDTFELRQMRFPSEAEVEFDDYKEYGKLHYPLTKTVSWAGKSVTVQVTSVAVKTGASLNDFYPVALELPSDLTLSGKGSAGALVEEFYKRFR